MQSQQHPDDACYRQLAESLSHHIDSSRIITEEAKRLAYGTDASFYRLIPKIVLQLKSLDEILLTIRECRKRSVPFTFRAAGTSLSGQAISNSVLITLTDDWCHHQVVNHGEKITLQPGVIGADANRYLAPFDKKIGPDPSSINACKIGGIAANNASGMCCGTAQNSYQTVDQMTIVFGDGYVLNTGDKNNVADFKRTHKAFLAGIDELGKTTRANAALTHRIHHKYRLKNTTGYALNALVDFTDPIDIIKHLMIGSEGTLGFIADITYNTVIEHRHKASALIVFQNIEQASQAVTRLSTQPVAAVEMMDGRSLRSVAEKPGMPEFIRDLDLEAAALLIEVQAHDDQDLNQRCRTVMGTVHEYPLIQSVNFTSEAAIVDQLWNIRKGLFPAVGAVREVGTTAIIEDVSFPIEQLAKGVRDLQALFDQYQYTEAIIFGHALAGNLHFVFNQGFSDPAEIQRYGHFMNDIADLVALKYQGSLKAEHGTGRNMAPYVELEWGHDAYQLMHKIKQLFDPEGLLNPGVIMNDDKNAHISHLKPMPAADPLIDRCIECGYCEPVCPSRTLSLSPRQRIVLYRELQRRRRDGETQAAADLENVFNYQGIDTCAVTGLCSQRCPVGINTGDLIKKLRTEKYHKFQPIARWTANHFATTTSLTRASLATSQLATAVIGKTAVRKITNGVRTLTHGKTPQWLPEMPTRNAFNLHQVPRIPHDRKVVYAPSCAARSMGQQAGAADKRPLTEVTISLLEKAGYEVIIPEHIDDQCCGQPYDSKGMKTLADEKDRQFEAVIWQASGEGQWPVLMDTSPCAMRLKNGLTHTLNIYEPAVFALKYLLPHLAITPKQETVMLHITCSSHHMGIEKEMETMLRRCVSDVVIPEHIECCAWAGDKGFTTPELNAAAVRLLKAQVPDNCHRGFSNSRTCEIGLSHYSGVPYQSVLYLLDEVSQPLPTTR